MHINDIFIQLLVTYRYIILIPIGLIEGHLISLIVGFLSKTGVFNPFVAGMYIITGNLIGDLCLYWIGYFKGERFVKRWGKYLGINDEKFLKSRAIYHNHKNSILLFSKLTNGFGMSMVILFTAGVMRINFYKYMILNFIGECIWTGGLISTGYFLGDVYILADSIIVKVGLIGVIVVVIMIVFFYFRNCLIKKIDI